MTYSFNNNSNSFDLFKISISGNLSSFNRASRNGISFSFTSSKENRSNKTNVQYEFMNLNQFYNEPDSSFYNGFYN